MRHALKRAIVLASALAACGCLHSPMPWSPDGKWIAYTVEVRPIESLIRPGWLFESPNAAGSPILQPCSPSGYRLWASRAETGESVLLAESSRPLTAPGWSPDGRALAFGRVVPEAEGRGRYEVVVLDAPGRERVVSSRPLAEIPAEEKWLPGQAIAWSPDGRYLAVPVLNPLGMAILRADNGRQVNAIGDAFLPSWSPDGSKLAFYVRGTGDVLQCVDSVLGRPRTLADVGQAGQAPIWLRDGQSLLAVVRETVFRGSEPPGEQAKLIKVRVDSGQLETFRDLRADSPLGRDRTVEGVSIAIDKDGQNLFCSMVVEGTKRMIVWYKPQDNQILNRFAIVDFEMPMGSLSISPDGSTLAARVGPVDRLSAPALCDLRTSDLRSRLIAPDDPTRVEWIARLVGSARGYLGSLKATTDLDGRLDRPSLLPALDEIDPGSEAGAALRRIGRMGLPLCDRSTDAPPPSPEVAALLDEARLFFAYLSGNYPVALAALDALEQSADAPDRRFKLLAIRAQVAIAQGQVDKADHAIAYLKELRKRPARRLEWTGAGYVVTGTDPVPGEGWAELLEARSASTRALLKADKPTDPVNPDNPRANFGFGDAARDPFPIDRQFFTNPNAPGMRRRLPFRVPEVPGDFPQPR